MGLPVNNFTFWAYLESEKKESWHIELRKIRQNFSLFGYIIHDPEAGDGFGKLLGERFSQLSRMTGTDFLFTAFVNPPGNFDNSNKFESGYYYRANQIINSDNILKSDLGSFYAISISEYLGINTASLPYIILTDDPSKNRFYFIELNRQNLFEVMSELTFLAGQIRKPESEEKFKPFPGESQLDYASFLKKKLRKPGKLENLIDSLNYPVYKIKLKQSLARTLLKISYKLQKFALNSVKVENIILGIDWPRQVENELKTIQEIEFQGAQIIHDYLKSDKGAIIKGDIIKQKENLLRELFELEPSDFEVFKSSTEPDTWGILLDGALLNSLYEEELFFDASPFVNPFGKAFEKEMTYSLVHWIREQLAINLPDYFYKYQPEKEAILQKGKSYFNYNQLKPSTTMWWPPMIGGQIRGFEVLTKEKAISPFKTREETNSFLEIGERIMYIRNQSSHTGIEGASSLKAIIHKWRELWGGGYLKQLALLKKYYKTGIIFN